MEIQTRLSVTELSERYGDEMLAIELGLEERMVTMGREQVRKQIEKAREKGNESATKYGQSLIASSIDTVSAGLTAWIDNASAGKAGRRHSAVKYLQLTEPDIAAFMAMRCVVDSLTGKRQLLQRVAISIGTRIEDEIRYTRFAKDHKKSYLRGMKKVKVSTTYNRKSASMAGTERYHSDVVWDAWPEQDKLHVGMVLIDIVLTTGLVTVGEEVASRRDTKKVLQPTEKLLTWVERENAKSELLTPRMLPMAVEPMPWTDPFDGGYLTASAQTHNALVKTNNGNYLTEMADRAEEMPAVYSSINALQSTRWCINKAVNALAVDMWENITEATPHPPREDLTHVPCPACGVSVELPKLQTKSSDPHPCFEGEYEGQKAGNDALYMWRKEAHKAHTRNVSLRSKRLVTAKTLRVAGMFADLDAMYFPYQLDFRGRVYAMPSFNPQGADLNKALIHFADGMAIEDGVGAGWLAIQGANVFGYDKASLEDRIQWVEDHANEIMEAAADPVNNVWWTQADSPWQFIAFCLEWAQFTREGYGFVSHLPVALDGSCSGIQHFSAMLRDKVGGAAVNLTSQKIPADIYQSVCDRVIEVLRHDVETLSSTIAQVSSIDSPIDEDLLVERQEGEDLSNLKSDPRRFASGWLGLEPNRKTTKRQVMTLPYGSTKYSCRGYTEEWLKERIEEGYDNPWPDTETFEATQYMATIIWDSIAEVVVAARNAMDWLQSCAKVVAKEQLPVYWQTPSGFPVMQVYNNFTSRRVKTKLGDAIVKLSLQQEELTIDRRRMANAISPNFVHSLDATHLVLSTDLAVNNDIHHFAMIHDSFGTHAANTDKLAACLREAFVGLYHGKDILEDFRAQIVRQVNPENHGDIRPVPEMGDLDVTEVRHSDFFFA